MSVYSSFAFLCNVAKSVLCDIESMEKRRVLIRRFGSSLRVLMGIFRLCVTSIYYNASLLLLCWLVGFDADEWMVAAKGVYGSMVSEFDKMAVNAG